jgi:hypothetical protein
VSVHEVVHLQDRTVERDDVPVFLQYHVFAEHLGRQKRAEEIQVEHEMDVVHGQIVECRHAVLLLRGLFDGEELLLGYTLGARTA